MDQPTVWTKTVLTKTKWTKAGLDEKLWTKTRWTKTARTPFYTWCNMFLTGLHHSPVVSIPLLLPSNSSTLPLFLPPLFARHLRFNHHHHYLYNISYCIHCVNILQFIHIIWSSCRVASYRQLNKFIPINVPFNEPILLETTIRWSPPLPSSP